MPEIKKLTIKRELWGKGTLRQPGGRMCCLGHLGKACGVSDSAMQERGFPNDLDLADCAKYPKAFQEDRYGLLTLAATINDSSTMRIADKEEHIKILFKSRGIKVTFTGDRKKADV